MITNDMLHTEADDIALVAESLTGNREAFGFIVQRYQSLICAVAYNATGSLSQSEDLAQETFVTAWRQLGALREPASLRPWLCRIARNLTCDALKKQRREPMDAAEPLEAADELPAREPSPPEQAITREEEGILWRSIERIPEGYREPLILFYREQQSVARVATALDLSEENVRQRLSRGRKLLQEQVLAFVEGALQRTGPGAGFAQGVLAALPAMSVSTTATTMSTIAKGGVTAKAVATGLGGVFLVFFGNYAGYRSSLALATSDGERQCIKRFYGRLLAAVIVSNIVLALLIFWGVQKQTKDHPALFAASFITLAVACVLAFVLIIFRAWRGGRARTTPFPPPAWEYRSATVFLGLPLVHFRVGGGYAGPNGVVKAWIAAGSCAVGGLFAFGGVAIAPFSVGGCAIGLMPWGGMSIGMFALGGIALGVWTFGGLALGWNAYGSAAIGWKAAAGAVAVAHDFALGNIAQAAQAGNAAAETYINGSPFFRFGDWFSHYAAWMNVLWVLPMFLWWRLAARARRRAAVTALLAVALFLSATHGGFAQDGSLSTNTISDRFDNLVRDDFFSGDPEKLRHAMKVCDDALAQNPKYAPALSWKGAGDLSLAGKAFQTNDVPTGLSLWRRGLKEMDDAVALQPESLQVLIPRGAAYLAIAKYDPNPAESKHLIETGVADYEKVYLHQQPYIDKISRHARGELLFGLADGWFRLGDMEKSRGYLQQITNSCPDSVYSRRAGEWLGTTNTAALKEKSGALSCVGCHGE